MERVAVVPTGPREIKSPRVATALEATAGVDCPPPPLPLALSLSSRPAEAEAAAGGGGGDAPAEEATPLAAVAATETAATRPLRRRGPVPAPGRRLGRYGGGGGGGSDHSRSNPAGDSVHRLTETVGGGVACTLPATVSLSAAAAPPRAVAPLAAGGGGGGGRRRWRRRTGRGSDA